MESLEPACPACGNADTQLCEIAWDTQRLEQAAPPVPRKAETNAGRFYAFNAIGLIGWVLMGLYVGTLIDQRPEAVVSTALVAGTGLFLHITWLLGHGPKPTADQVAALEDWHAAHAEWERTWFCAACGTTFLIDRKA